MQPVLHFELESASEDTEQKLRHAMPSGWYLERFALPRYAAYQVSNNAAG
ncbi:hypothetical protein [Candidatus Nitrotoga sp. AM1P]|nr:hypothetical protein [Candidatus Nitrotoga sp. AM1P]